MNSDKHFVALSPQIILSCATVLEHRLYEHMAAMHQSNKVEMSLKAEDYVSDGEINKETGEIYEQKIETTDITADLFNGAIKSIGEYGFGQAEYFQVIEKNIGGFYLQYVQS